MPRLNADHFNTKEFQIQRKNHFEVILPQDFFGDEMQLLVFSFPLPKETTESFDAPYFNQSVKLPTKTTFDDGSLVIRDAIGYDTELKFLEWRKKVYNVETAEMGYAADFKRDMTVIEYDPNGTTGRKWLLKGCWPSSIDNGELNYDDFGEKQLTIGIKYDKAYRITE